MATRTVRETNICSCKECRGPKREGRSVRRSFDINSEPESDSDDSSGVLKKFLERASVIGGLARSKFLSGDSKPQKWCLTMEELEHANRQDAVFVGPGRALPRSVEFDELEKGIKRAIAVLELAGLILVFRPTALEMTWIRITVPVEDRTEETNMHMIVDFLHGHLAYETEFYSRYSSILTASEKDMEACLDVFVRLYPKDREAIIDFANMQYGWCAIPVAEPTPMEIEQIIACHEYTLGHHMDLATDCVFLCGEQPLQLLDWINHFLEDHVNVSDGLQPATPLTCPWCAHKLMDWDHISAHIFAHLRLDDVESSWNEGWHRKGIWEYIRSVERILPRGAVFDYLPPPWPTSLPFWKWEDIQAILKDTGDALEEERILQNIDLSAPNSVPDIVLDRLSKRLRRNLSFRSGSWTFFGRPSLSGPIPIAISNCPVIIPVQALYPASGEKAIPPPDPHPDKLLNPQNVLSELSVRRLMNTFPFANAFYVLFNGTLQIWVDDDFDYRWAAYALPRTFGGLYVSYFKHGPKLTSSHSSSLYMDEALFSSRDDYSVTRTPFSSHDSTMTVIKPVPYVQIGREIEVSNPRVRGPLSRSRLGVALEIQNPDNPSETEIVVTVSSHAIIVPVPHTSRNGHFPQSSREKEEYSFWGRNMRKILGAASSDVDMGSASNQEDSIDYQSRTPPNFPWWEDCQVYAAGTNLNIGTICHTYDPDIRPHHRFPTNYSHDISLLRPLHIGVLSALRSPAKHWYPHRVVDPSSSIFLVGPDGTRWGSSVGTGYLVREKRYSDEQKSTDINSMISRCVLWRPLDPERSWEGLSGTPVFVLERGRRWLLGFMGFVQHVEEPSRPTSNRENGYVAFAACMIPPQELLDAKIL